MVYTFYYNTLSEKYAVDVRQIVFQFSNENFRDPLISLPHTHALISPRYISEGGGGELNEKEVGMLLKRI